MAKCPHCEKEITLQSAKKDESSEIQKEVEGMIKKEVMYSCPHCDSVLGFAFFFGRVSERDLIEIPDSLPVVLLRHGAPIEVQLLLFLLFLSHSL